MVLLSIVIVAAVGVELTRWKLFGNFSTTATSKFDAERLPDLADALAARYRQRHGWSFLPVESEQRNITLREMVRWHETLDAQRGNSSASPSLEYRIGLLDKDRHYLAGAIADPLLVMFASIDRVQRPLVVDGKTVGYIVAARPQNPDDALAVAFLLDQQQNIFIVAVISVLLSALMAAWLAAHFRKPIRQLVDGARRLEDGQFDSRLAIHRSDELGELAATFNHLAAYLEHTEHSRQQWVADTSHELRTPLSVLRGQMEALQDGVRNATPGNIAIMLAQVHVLTRLVDDLHALARADIEQLSCDKTIVDVWPLVMETLDAFSGKLSIARLSVTIGASPAHTTVRCDPDRMRQVLANLLENCVRYTDAGGCIRVQGAVVGDTLRIVIDDSAPGVSGQSLGRLGERFFRVEPSRNRKLGGAGLGLSLCRKILEAHDGRLEFAPSPLGGLRTTVVMALES